MFQHSEGDVRGHSGGLRHGLDERSSAAGGSFLPNFQALLERLDGLFWRYSARRAEALRNRLNSGTTSLTDCDILQLVLDPVSGGRNTKRIAEALLNKFRTFGNVINAPAGELMTVSGIGEAGAAALKTVSVAAMHLLRHAVSNEPILATSKNVKDYLAARLQHERVEVFFVLYLDGRNRLIEGEELCRGTVNNTPAYPRELMRRCLELDATAIIIAHNHPSGNLQPSYLDIEITEDIVIAAKALGISVIDHIIVGRGETHSMRARGLL